MLPPTPTTDGPRSLADAPRTVTRGWLSEAALPLAIVVIGYALIVFVTLRAFDFNPSGPIRIGDLLPAERFWTAETRVDPGVGYDGQ